MFMAGLIIIHNNRLNISKIITDNIKILKIIKFIYKSIETWFFSAQENIDSQRFETFTN